MPPLACSVRDCRQPLIRQPTRWACANGHSFDIARRGYVNLLQPQDRRSDIAGDAPDAVRARARLADAGVGSTLQADIIAHALTCTAGIAQPVIVELGCGTGHLLRALAAATPSRRIGIDLSTAAIDIAAPHDRDTVWVVANADRRLPLLDASVDLVLSVHARRNPGEVARVLRAGRHAIVAVPADDDLIELRHLTQGQRLERDRVDALVAEYEPAFRVMSRTTSRVRQHVEGAGVRDLSRMTYRGVRHREAERLATVDGLDVTMASDVVVFGKR